MLHKRLFLFFLFFLAIIKGLAQHKVYEQFTAKEGLPSNTIYDMTQDERGYMLFATDNGLSQFDGTVFTTFSITDGLPDNEILKLFKDSQNRIWLMGFNGEVGYLQNGHFFNSQNTPFLAGLSFKNNIDEVYEDRSGNIWFYGRNSILRCLTTNSKVLRSNNHTADLYTRMFVELDNEALYLVSNFPKNEIQLLHHNEATITLEVVGDANADLFFEEHLLDFRKKGFYFKTDSLGMRLYNHLNQNVKGFNSFWPPKIHLESSGYYWSISNFTGLYLMANKEKEIHPVFIKKEFAASSYFKDIEGNEWVSSINSGVLFFPNTKIKTIDFKETNDLQIVYRSKDSHIYIGDYQGNLLVLEDNDQPKLLFKNDRTKFSRSVVNRINDILEYDGHIISIHNSDLRIFERKNNAFTGRFAILSIASGKRGFIINDTLYLACSNNVYSILLDQFIKQARWSNNQSVNFIQLEDEIPNNSYRKIIWKNRSSAILKDRDNKLWIGNNKGLFYVANDRILPFSIRGFQKCNITDIKEMTNGTILVATNGYGLGVIEKKKAYFIHKIGEELNPVINSIALEKNNIWLATNTGLSGFVLKDNNLSLLKRYTPLEGLSSKNIRKLIAKDSVIYASSPNGLNIIDRRKKTDEDRVDIPIYLHRTTINNTSQDSLNVNALKHYQNDLNITYTGISFRSLGNLKYKYRLKPWETDWVITNNKEVRYSNLPPNSYTFEVMAVDKDGAESQKSAVFNFNIKNAWYDNFMVKMTAIFLAIFLIWYLISLRIKSIRTQSAYNEKIAILKHQALLAQMNPHFIHNSLSSIQQFILSHNVDQAQNQLSRFASLIRAILDNSKKIAITLADEIDLVENYLKLERVRFDNGFSFNIDISVKELDTIEIPPMIIQPIVENAIIHGVGALNKKSGKINVKIDEIGDCIQCVVTDNGIGIKTSMELKNKSILVHNSLALSNIRERLELYHGDAFKMSAIELYNDSTHAVTGTKVTVLMPIINRL